MIPFQTSITITDMTQLFGRDDQMRMLLNSAERHDNVGIIGSRRFGKTCLLQCAYNEIKKSKNDIIPIFFDAHRLSIKHDTDLVYRKIISLILTELCIREIISKGELVLSRLIRIQVCEDLESNEEELSKFSSERQRSSLEKIIKFLKDKNVYVICIFDEVEYLLLEALNEVRDFARFRVLAQEEEMFNFWIASSVSWDELCSKTGSPELNGGLTPIPVPPLSQIDFSTMWEYEVASINDPNTQQFLRSVKEYAFDKSGGIPFYAKEIGKFICTSNKQILPDYSIVRSHLKMLWQNRFIDNIERNILTIIAQNDINYGEVVPDGIKSLEEKGIVVSSSNKYSLKFGYLKDFILASLKDINTDTIQEADIEWGNLEIEDLVQHIVFYRKRLNTHWKDNNLYHHRSDGSTRKNALFEARDEDSNLFDILKEKCLDRKTYTSFTGALYTLYYEGSYSGNTLPRGYDMNTTNGCQHSFPPAIKIVDAQRHMFLHPNYSPNHTNQINAEKVYELLNNGKNFVSKEDYERVQKYVLTIIVKELDCMLKHIKTLK